MELNQLAPCVARERAVSFKVQRQVHRVEKTVLELETEVPRAGDIEGRDVVQDVVSRG